LHAQFLRFWRFNRSRFALIAGEGARAPSVDGPFPIKSIFLGEAASTESSLSNKHPMPTEMGEKGGRVFAIFRQISFGSFAALRLFILKCPI
jgi:hypothetical protein